MEKRVSWEMLGWRILSALPMGRITILIGNIDILE